MNYIKRISDISIFDDNINPKSPVDGQNYPLDNFQDYQLVDYIEDQNDQITSTHSVDIIYIALYVILLGITKILARISMQYYSISPSELLIARSGIEIVLCLIYLWYSGLSLFNIEGSKSGEFLANALISFFSLFAHLISLQILPLGVALGFECLGYHFVSFFDALSFTRNFTLIHILGYLTAFIGVAVIVNEYRDYSLR